LGNGRQGKIKTKKIKYHGEVVCPGGVWHVDGGVLAHEPGHELERHAAAASTGQHLCVYICILYTHKHTHTHTCECVTHTRECVTHTCECVTHTRKCVTHTCECVNTHMRVCVMIDDAILPYIEVKETWYVCIYIYIYIRMCVTREAANYKRDLVCIYASMYVFDLGGSKEI
jgi:hypothetical protein